MLDYIFSGLCAGIAEMIEVMVGWFLDVMNFSKDQFDTVFPFAKATFGFFQDVAILIVLFLAAKSVYNIFKGGDRLRETPGNIVANTIMAVAGIYLGNYALEGIISVGMIGYNAIQIANISPGTPEANLVSLAVSQIASFVAELSILVYLIILVNIAWQFLKLLLEAIERFMWLYVLLYTSPLAFSTLASSATSDTFRKFLSMFISQALLMVLNIWSVKMALSVFASIGTIGNNDTVIVPLLFGFGFLRIAQRFDTTLNQLGMNAAITGGGLGADLLGSFMAMGKSFSGGVGAVMGGGSSGGGGGGNPGGVVGAAKKLAGAYNRYSPTGWVSRAAANYGAAQASTILGAVGHGAAEANNGGDFWASAKDYYQGNSGRANAEAANKTQMESEWANHRQAPAGFTTTTEAWAAGIASPETEMSREALHLAGQRADVATAVMSQVQRTGSSITDNGRNSAMLQSMQVPESTEFLQAANGTLAGATNASSVTDANGMHFRYDKDNKTHTMDVLNHAQYTALHPGNKAGFEEHIAPDGSKKYVRTGVSKAEEPKEQTSPPPMVDTLPEFAGYNPGADPGFAGDTVSGTAVLGAAADGPQYSDEEVAVARQEAYQYHSGNELDDEISPATAGEILDGYTNEGVTPLPSIPVGPGAEGDGGDIAQLDQDPGMMQVGPVDAQSDAEISTDGSETGQEIVTEVKQDPSAGTMTSSDKEEKGVFPPPVDFGQDQIREQIPRMSSGYIPSGGKPVEPVGGKISQVPDPDPDGSSMMQVDSTPISVPETDAGHVPVGESGSNAFRESGSDPAVIRTVSNTVPQNGNHQKADSKALEKPDALKQEEIVQKEAAVHRQIESEAVTKLPTLRAAPMTNETPIPKSVSSTYAQVSGERTVTTPANTTRTPTRGVDTDVDRVYTVAKAAAPKNVPRRESIMSVKQDADGIRMKTQTGSWELRPENYVRKQSQEKQKEYKLEHVSPQGNQYYSRFRPTQTKESHNAKKKRNNS